VPNTWFNEGKTEVANGGIVLLTDTIKAMVVTSSYVFSATHQFASSASSFEISGTGYVSGFGNSGRKTLTSKTITLDNINNRMVFDAADLTWTAVTAGTIGGVILLKEITNDAASKLLAYFAVTPFTTVGVDINLVWDASGVLWIS
jgi:hypothetical protein